LFPKSGFLRYAAPMSSFSLFSTPIDLAHHFWALHLQQKTGIVIDATCGNGKDSLFLASLVQHQKDSSLFCIDIQECALQTTQHLLEEEIPQILPKTHFIQGSHEKLPALPLSLIVYNLGYLPGGDKTLTTCVPSSLQSFSLALQLLLPGGLMSVTCYPGHIEGQKEEKACYTLFSSLDPKEWNVTFFTWPHRGKAPSLFLIQRSNPQSKQHKSC